MAGEQGTVNIKIYYSLGRLREGADGDRCSLELARQVRRGETLGGSLRRWRRECVVQWPVSELRVE